MLGCLETNRYATETFILPDDNQVLNALMISTAKVKFFRCKRLINALGRGAKCPFFFP